MRVIICVLLISLLAACDQGSEQTLEELKGGFEKGIESAQKTLESLGSDKKSTTGKAVDEVEKLFRFEYQVFRINRELGTNEIQKRLSELGEKRWDCFHIENLGQEIEVYCKRRPKSYLRYFKAL